MLLLGVKFSPARAEDGVLLSSGNSKAKSVGDEEVLDILETMFTEFSGVDHVLAKMSSGVLKTGGVDGISKRLAQSSIGVDEVVGRESDSAAETGRVVRLVDAAGDIG